MLKTRIGEIATKVGSGSTPKGGKNSYKGGNVALIRSQNVRDMYFDYNGLAYINDEQAQELDNVEVKSGDILFNITGDSIARCCIVPDDVLPARVNQHVAIIRIPTIDSHYLMYKMQFLKSYLLSISHGGSSRNAITKKGLENIEIKIPRDANNISRLLDALSDKVINNNNIVKQLNLIAKTIYDYWFLQFEFPNEEGKPYKSSGGKMVWNEELQREIPDGWEVGSISLLINYKKNGDWGKENMQGNYVLPVSCIRGADLDFVNGKSLSSPPTRFILEKNSSKLLKPYDLIVEISGGSPTQSTGRIAGISSYLFSRFNNGIVCSNFCKAITLKDKVNYYYFLQTWKTLFENDVMFNWEGKTSGIKNLMFDSFVKNTKIVIPNKGQLSTFFDLCDGIDNKIQNLLKQNQELLSLRDFLLPLLMNGQVTVVE